MYNIGEKWIHVMDKTGAVREFNECGGGTSDVN